MCHFWLPHPNRAELDEGRNMGGGGTRSTSICLAAEIEEKLRTKQARLVAWDNIKYNPPPQLKISPIAAIPHKSKAFRSILDLSFRLRLKNGGILAAVNDTTIKSAPKGVIDQLGECLTWIIHAFAEASDDAKIFMAKWDIKDGSLRMDCRDGEEWNFAYVLPQPKGSPTMLVMPTSLQMGWEAPPYFCTATETARDIATVYTDMPVEAIPEHKLSRYTVDGESYADLPEDHEGQPFRKMIEVYVDDFMSLVIPISKSQLQHTAAAVMTGIHDVFSANDEDDGDDPISENKLKKIEGQYSTAKTLLGFDFDGIHKTMWLEAAKQEKLLTVLQGWIRTGHRGSAGIPFKEFESTVAKIRHAFTCIPMGASLLSPYNRILKTKDATGLCISQSEQTDAHVNRGVSDAPPRINTGTNVLPRTYSRLAGLYRLRRRIKPWCGGSCNRRAITVRPHDLSVAMAARCYTGYQNGGESGRTHHKFGFGDGQPHPVMAYHGGNLRTTRGETSHLVQ